MRSKKMFQGDPSPAVFLVRPVLYGAYFGRRELTFRFAREAIPAKLIPHILGQNNDGYFATHNKFCADTLGGEMQNYAQVTQVMPCVN